jgi:hypothetical protein
MLLDPRPYGTVISATRQTLVRISRSNQIARQRFRLAGVVVPQLGLGPVNRTAARQVGVGVDPPCFEWGSFIRKSPN